LEGAQEGNEGASQKKDRASRSVPSPKLLVAVLMRSVSGDAIVHLERQALTLTALCRWTGPMVSVARNCANAGGVPA
jgi:hypothetical protein